MKNIIYVILLFLLGVVVGWFCNKCSNQQQQVDVSDTITITYYDTIEYYQPIPVDSTIVRYDVKTLKRVINDTSYVYSKVEDSVKVEIPITSKHYSDSTFEAWISGYEPCLDSIRVYNKMQKITIKEKQKKWGIGIQGGIGVTPKSVQPYIGIGVSYNLFSF